MGRRPQRPVYTPPPPPPPTLVANETLINQRCWGADDYAYYLGGWNSSHILETHNTNDKNRCQNLCENHPECQSTTTSVFTGLHQCHLLKVPMWYGTCDSKYQLCAVSNCPKHVPLTTNKCISKANHAQCLS